MTISRSLPVRLAAILLFTAIFSRFPALHAQAPGAPLRLTTEEAVQFALDQNLALAGARFGPQLADVDVQATTTRWTPELSTRFGGTRAQEPSITAFDSTQSSLINRQVSSDIAWSQQLPWGSSYRVSWTAARYSSTSSFVRFEPELRAGATATYIQPLLKGLRFDDARAAYASSVENRAIAGSELSATVAATRRQVLYAYWQWVHTRDVLAVHRESLALAQALLDGNRARVAAGAMAAVDVIEAEAEVARRSESIVVAVKAVANAEDVVRMLIFAPRDARSALPLEPASIDPGAVPSAAGLVERSLDTRRDLSALRSSVTIADIATRRYRNDMLPDASVRVDYGLRGAAGVELLRAQGFTGPVTGSFARGFGSALDDLARSRYPTWSVELGVSYPIGLAASEASAARAVLARQQEEAVLRAAEQRAATEVRAIVREVDANRERQGLSATTVSLAQRRLEAEQRKFAVGLSTSFFVFQAQRDLASSREAALRSALDYRLSVADIEAVQIIPLTR